MGSETWISLESGAGDSHRTSSSTWFCSWDLRPPNIRISEEGLKVLDFDFAGREGEAVYPRCLNKEDITWPDDAVVGGLIRYDHDLFMLEQLPQDPI